MTLTIFPSSDISESPDLAVLNLSRLFARLEQNLLSSTADLKPLRRSEYQRMRVGANLDYARGLLLQLEKSLPQIKPLDRRHDIQTELARKRQTLKLLTESLEEISAQAEARVAKSRDTTTTSTTTTTTVETWSDDEDENDDEDDGHEDLLATPEGDDSISEHEQQRDDSRPDTIERHVEMEISEEIETDYSLHQHDHGRFTPSSSTTTSTTELPATTAAAPTVPTPALRNRHNHNKPTTPTSLATATGTPFHRQQPSKLATSEQALSSQRLEQEDLTSSLLSLAGQLKASSQAFQTSLESEKSVLARAVEGLDRTTSGMEAAEKRMGMLRRMTEGKGWWGRMMLYAWIFGLWIIALLIVFLGPKLRF